MEIHEAVVDSFLLYVLYVLLPLVPAILIFKFFPDTKVTVSGPLQNLTVNATGAFGAYVVTVALGFFLVKNVESQIQYTRLYPVQGIIDLDENQVIASSEFYLRHTNEMADSSGKFQSHEVYFVELLDHPVEKKTVWLSYWELPAASGLGPPPPLGRPQTVPMDLIVRDESPQRFSLKSQGGTVAAVRR